MLLTYKTTLSQKIQLTFDVYLYYFDLLEPKEINFEAGQYLMIKIPTDKGPVSRLYSIASSAAEKNSFELIIQIISGGLASSYLSNLKVKDEVVFKGPAGMFCLRKNERPKIFLTTGTGIAPVRSMLKSTLDVRSLKLDKEVGSLNLENQSSNVKLQNPTSNFQHQTSIFLFWGLKTYKDVYLLDELKEFNPTICLSREQNLDMIPEEDKKYFELGHVDICFEKQFNNLTIEQLNNYDFYLCGRREIVESLRQFLVAKNVPKENIYFEKF